jgi:putative transposase
MRNHVHLLIKPLDKLPKVMLRLKGGRAKLINEFINKNRRLWTGDYFNKQIRDEKHFVVVYQYTKNSSFKLCEAKAKASPARFYGTYESSGLPTGMSARSGSRMR